MAARPAGTAPLPSPRCAVRVDHQADAPYSDVLGILGLAGTLIAFGITIPEADLRIYGEIFGALIVLSVWPAVRYLGSLSAIMNSAASTDEGTRKVFRDMQRGMGNVEAYASLRDIYKPLIKQANAGLAGSAAMLELATAPGYAAATLRTGGLASLTTLLGNLRTDNVTGKRSEKRADSRQKLVDHWKAINRDFRDEIGSEEGDNYCLTEIRLEDGRLLLDLCVATYGQISRTCESLVNEFALFAHIVSRDGLVGRMRSSTVLRCLPWRKLAHDVAETAEQLFLKPRGRAAGVGVTLATFSGRGQGNVYLGERSNMVGTYPNVLHLIPAGNCNTHGTHRQLSHTRTHALPTWYLQSIMKCEYLEEWFDDQDLEELQILDWRGRVDRLWKDRIHEISPIHLTGITYDLLNLRPEICAVVKVEFTGSEKLNWEFKRGVPPEELTLANTESIMPNEIVQAAAGALILARSYSGPGIPKRHDTGEAAQPDEAG